MGYLDDLEKLKELLDTGAISEAEYEGQKANILAANAPGATNQAPGAGSYASRTEYGQPYVQQMYAVPPANDSLRLVAFIFNLIITIILGMVTFGIGLAWGIPMTVLTYKSIKSPYRVTALGVCSLIFMGVVPGILLLCSGGTEKPLQ